MTTVGVLLARTGSSRLPGKSLADVCGRPMVAHIIDRMRGVAGIDTVVLATPDLVEDAALREAGERAGADVYAGAADDVLGRLYQAARAHAADVVVHIGGDCPFADRGLMQRAIELLAHERADYVSNLSPMTYPSGLDVDAFSFEALERMWSRATLRTNRVHCVSYIYQNPDEFRVVNFEHDVNLGQLRWTLDYPEDLEFVRTVYDRLGADGAYFAMDEILRLLEREPALGRINAHLSAFVLDQPAYWDSEGYMADIRSDLQTLVAEAARADAVGDLHTAARRYAQAGTLLADLLGRARALAARTVG